LPEWDSRQCYASVADLNSILDRFGHDSGVRQFRSLGPGALTHFSDWDIRAQRKEGEIANA